MSVTLALHRLDDFALRQLRAHRLLALRRLPDGLELGEKSLRRTGAVEIHVDDDVVRVIGALRDAIGAHAVLLALRGIAVEHLLPELVVTHLLLYMQSSHGLRICGDAGSPWAHRATRTAMGARFLWTTRCAVRFGTRRP